MSKYVKELMMDQLKADLGQTRSILILDFKGLDAVAENRLRLDLRNKQIHVRVLRNALARKVFSDLGMPGLSQFLAGPSVAVWGGEGIVELAKELSDRIKKLKAPEIKGGAVEGTIVGAHQVDDITKLPSRELLIGRVVSLAMAPVQRVLSLATAPASNLLAQLQTIAETATDASPEEAPAPADPAPEEASAPANPAPEEAPAPADPA